MWGEGETDGLHIRGEERTNLYHSFVDILTYLFCLAIWALNLLNIWALEFPFWKSLVGLFFKEPRDR